MLPFHVFHVPFSILTQYHGSLDVVIFGANPLLLFPQVIRSLRSLEREAFPNGAVVEIRDVDYNLLSFEEQILNDLETDVMVRSDELMAKFSAFSFDDGPGTLSEVVCSAASLLDRRFCFAPSFGAYTASCPREQPVVIRSLQNEETMPVGVDAHFS